MINVCSKFLKKIPSKSTVLLVLENPKNQYNKIFDGYRMCYELIFFVGNLQKKLIYPDWHAIFEIQIENLKGHWGKSPKQVKKNLKNFQTKYALVYQKTGSDLNNKWKKENFKIISTLDWSIFLKKELDLSLFGMIIIQLQSGSY